MIIFQTVNCIESKYSVSFAWISLGAIKRIFPFFFVNVAVCVESDKPSIL